MTISTLRIEGAMTTDLNYQVHETQYPHEYHFEIVGKLMVLKMIDSCLFESYFNGYLEELQEELWSVDEKSDTAQSIRECIAYMEGEKE